MHDMYVYRTIHICQRFFSQARNFFSFASFLASTIILQYRLITAIVLFTVLGVYVYIYVCVIVSKKRSRKPKLSLPAVVVDIIILLFVRTVRWVIICVYGLVEIMVLVLIGGFCVWTNNVVNYLENLHSANVIR